MLSELCHELNNYFVRDDGDKHFGSFTIAGGIVNPCDFLIEGQYFRIVGSVLNDGVYRYGDRLRLADETFDGAIWAMSVPSEVLKLSEEIDEWKSKYSESANSPFISESLGGYSYTKPSTSSESSWQSSYKSQLNRWRKIR